MLLESDVLTTQLLCSIYSARKKHNGCMCTDLSREIALDFATMVQYLPKSCFDQSMSPSDVWPSPLYMRTAILNEPMLDEQHEVVCPPARLNIKSPSNHHHCVIYYIVQKFQCQSSSTVRITTGSMQLTLTSEDATSSSLKKWGVAE